MNQNISTPAILTRVITGSCIVFLIVLLSFSPSNSEMIDGPANIREKPNGKIIARLNTESYVELMPPYQIDKAWFPIAFVVYVNKSDLVYDKNSNKIIIKKYSSLLNEKSNIIGQATNDFEAAWDLPEEHGNVGLVIENAFTHVDNIKTGSIPEHELESILLEHQIPITKSDLNIFLEKFDFQEIQRHKDKDMFSYCYYESWIYDVSPMPRLELIIYKNKLTAIIYRALFKPGKYKSMPLFRNMNIMFLTESEEERKIIWDLEIEPLRTAD